MHGSLRKRLTPWLFIAPFLLIFLVFDLFPYLYGLRLSMTNARGFSSGRFVGLANYTRIFSDSYFLAALKNSALYLFWSLFLHVPLPFILALALNKPSMSTRLRSMLRGSFFVPFLLSSAVVGVMFRVLFMKEFGAANWILGLAGFEPRDWLHDAGLSMPLLVVVATWMYVGFHMVYYLAALQSINPELYEAAQIDGASRFTQATHITVPLMMPAIAYVVLRITIGALQIFELPFILYNDTPYGPGRSAYFLMSYIYQYGFEYGYRSMAAAAGWISFVIIFVFTQIQLRFLRLESRNYQ
jgi:ABC-type sugar transport system permease subunit